MSDWLPLFPLGQPLFPGIRLDLQIFEQRYLKLVKACLKEGSQFGICPIEDGSEVGVPAKIYSYGTEVEIVDWTQLDNGLLGITVLGGKRFRVIEQIVDPFGLRSAQVSYLPEEESVFIPPEVSGLAEIYQELMLHKDICRRLPEFEEIDSSGLGFGLAQILPMSKEERLTCLTQLDSLARLDFLVEHIELLANSSLSQDEEMTSK